MPAPISLNILGYSLSVIQPYEAGQQISAAEAAELNKLKFERQRAAAQRAAKAKGQQLSQAELQELIDSFNWLSGAKWQPPADPTQKEAEQIARSAARAALARKAESPESISQEAFRELVSSIAQSAEVQAEARRRVLVAQQSARALLAEGIL